VETLTVAASFNARNQVAAAGRGRFRRCRSRQIMLPDPLMSEPINVVSIAIPPGNIPAFGVWRLHQVHRVRSRSLVFGVSLKLDRPSHPAVLPLLGRAAGKRQSPPRVSVCALRELRPVCERARKGHRAAFVTFNVAAPRRGERWCRCSVAVGNEHVVFTRLRRLVVLLVDRLAGGHRVEHVPIHTIAGDDIPAIDDRRLSVTRSEGRPLRRMFLKSPVDSKFRLERVAHALVTSLPRTPRFACTSPVIVPRATCPRRHLAGEAPAVMSGPIEKRIRAELGRWRGWIVGVGCGVVAPKGGC